MISVNLTEPQARALLANADIVRVVRERLTGSPLREVGPIDEAVGVLLGALGDEGHPAAFDVPERHLVALNGGDAA